MGPQTLTALLQTFAANSRQTHQNWPMELDYWNWNDCNDTIGQFDGDRSEIDEIGREWLNWWIWLVGLTRKSANFTWIWWNWKRNGAIAIEIEWRRIKMAEIGLKWRNLFVICRFQWVNDVELEGKSDEIGDFSHWNWTTTDRNGRNWVEIKQFVCYWPFSMDKRCWIGREMAILATLAIEMWTTPDKNGRNWVEIEEFVCYLPVWMGERRWKCHKIARIAKKGRFSTRFCSGLNLETPSKASLRLRLLLLLLRLLPLLLFLLSYFSFLHLANWKLVRIGGW